MDSDGGSSSDGSGETYERQILDGEESPTMGLLEALADIDGCDVTDLPALYPCIDDMVEKLYADPPSQDAQASLEFSYHGYRITLQQDGFALIREQP